MTSHLSTFQLPPSKFQTFPTGVDLRNPRRHRRLRHETQSLDCRRWPSHFRRLGPDGFAAPYVLHRRGGQAQHRRKAAVASSGRHHRQLEPQGQHQVGVGRTSEARRRLSIDRPAADQVIML